MNEIKKVMTTLVATIHHAGQYLTRNLKKVQSVLKYFLMYDKLIMPTTNKWSLNYQPQGPVPFLLY